MSNVVIESWEQDVIKLFDLGLAVFPLVPNGKNPSSSNGCKDAVKEIEQLAVMMNEGENVGVEAYRSNCILVDVDTKAGRDGGKLWKEWESKWGKVQTRSATTPNNGKHYYFKRPNGFELIRNFKDSPLIGDGIEFKVHNQYLVAPPSSLDGKSYKWDNDLPITEMPQWLLDIYIKAAIGENVGVDVSKAKSTVTMFDDEGKKDGNWKYSAADVVERCNRENDIEKLLAKYGWKATGKQGWMVHPNATTSTMSTHILDGCSYHFGASDSLAGNGVGKDKNLFYPFHIITHFEYGGNAKEAIKDLSKKYGMNEAVKPLEPLVTSGEFAEGVTEDTKATPFQIVKPFDLNRLPKEILEGAAGLSGINDLLEFSHHLLIALVYAGTMIGKRIVVHNKGNIYYPNLWAIALAESGSNKSGSLTQFNNVLTEYHTVGTSPTFEALTQGLGGVISLNKKQGNQSVLKTGEEIAEEKEQAKYAAKRRLIGKILVSDEITGTLNLILGVGHKNLQSFMNLSASGWDEVQSRIGNGIRVAYDICLSFFGFSQQETWLKNFDSEMYRTTGFLSRFLVSSGHMEWENMPKAEGHKWTFYANGVQGLVKELKNNKTHTGWSAISDDQIVITDEALISKAFEYLKTTDVFKALVEIVTDAKELPSKILIHGIKIASICYLFDRKNFGEHLKTGMELACYFFYATYRYMTLANKPLESVHNRMAAYIREKPRTLRDIQYKFSFKDKATTHDQLELLIEAGQVRKKPNPRNSRSYIAEWIKG